ERGGQAVEAAIDVRLVPDIEAGNVHIGPQLVPQRLQALLAAAGGDHLRPRLGISAYGSGAESGGGAGNEDREAGRVGLRDHPCLSPLVSLDGSVGASRRLAVCQAASSCSKEHAKGVE